jgi:hypothetical protein
VRKLQEIGRLFTKVEANTINTQTSGRSDCGDAFKVNAGDCVGLDFSID